MSQDALKKRIRLRFRDCPSDVVPFSDAEQEQWEHVASYSKQHHAVEDDADMIHVFRRKTRTVDSPIPGHSAGAADPRPSKLRDRLAEINRKNTEFWKARS